MPADLVFFDELFCGMYSEMTRIQEDELVHSILKCNQR